MNHVTYCALIMCLIGSEIVYGDISICPVSPVGPEWLGFDPDIFNQQI